MSEAHGAQIPLQRPQELLKSAPSHPEAAQEQGRGRTKVFTGVLVRVPSFPSSPREGCQGERRGIIPPFVFVQTGSPGKSRNNHRFDTTLLLDMSTEHDEDKLRRRGNGCCKGWVGGKTILWRVTTQLSVPAIRNKPREVKRGPAEGRSHLDRAGLTWTGQLPGQRQRFPSGKPRCCSAPR